MKVSIIGAGSVGASCAEYIAIKSIASHVVLLDIKKGLAEGKTLDIYQSATLLNYNTKVVGVTNDYQATENSDVVVITSGIPRKPGISAELWNCRFGCSKYFKIFSQYYFYCCIQSHGYNDLFGIKKNSFAKK